MAVAEHPVKVKICGITRLNDARVAQELGADSLGFVFVPASARFLTPEAAATIVPGVQIYQMTEAGLALQATLQGTKYWKDDELN